MLSLTALHTLVTFVVLAVLSFGVLALAWGRPKVWWTKVLVRAGAMTVATALVLLSAGLYVNRQAGFYASWNDLLTPADSHSGELGPPPGTFAATGPTAAAEFQLSEFSLAGKRSGLTQPVTIVLPPQYHQAAWAHAQFPIIVLIGGFPSRRTAWTRSMHFLPAAQDAQAEGRLPPAIYVIPQASPSLGHDTECVDAAPGYGPQEDTFLSGDLMEYLHTHYRSIVKPQGNAIMGLSTGGYCAVNLAMRHPDVYGASASFGGYYRTIVDHTTGAVFHGAPLLRLANDDIWRAGHLPVPQLPFLFMLSKGDSLTQLSTRALLNAAHGELRATILSSPGAHNFATFRSQLPFAFAWLGQHLAPPQGLPLIAPGSTVVNDGAGVGPDLTGIVPLGALPPYVAPVRPVKPSASPKPRPAVSPSPTITPHPTPSAAPPGPAPHSSPSPASPAPPSPRPTPTHSAAPRPTPAPSHR